MQIIEWDSSVQVQNDNLLINMNVTCSTLKQL